MSSPNQTRESSVQLAAMLLADHAANDGTRLEKHYRELLSKLIWKWTEADGKYKGCRYWTAGALKPETPKKEWRHEHIVPRKILVTALLSLEEPSIDAVRGIFSRFAIACVVTRTEHLELSDATWDELCANPWERYRRAEIEVVDTERD